MAEPSPDGRESWELPALIAASLASLAYFASFQFHISAPVDFDVYYHLGVTRELFTNGPLRSFPWTPHSILSERFADKEFLFHVILGAVHWLPVTEASRWGTFMGQAFFVSMFAFALWRMKTPQAWLFVLLLTVMGTALPMRLSMCRPHVWGIGFSVLVIWMLIARVRPSVLFVTAMLYSQFHTAGWIALFYAGVWVFWELVLPDRETGQRRLDWKPLAVVMAGWTAGQVLHPNFPANLHLLFVQNVLVPFHTTAAGDAALRWSVGPELTPPGPEMVAREWLLYVLAAGIIWQLARRELRTRETLTVSTIALAFLAASTLFMRRFYEMSVPFTVLALAVVWKTWRETRSGFPPEPGKTRVRPVYVIAALLVLLPYAGHIRRVMLADTAGATLPYEMARWMGGNVKEPAKVFTAQWADSAPLFYFAPWLTTMVALDPTFFHVKDPALFARYSEIVRGKAEDPVGEIMERFGARYVTLWKERGMVPLVRQIELDPRSHIAYQDDHYVIWRLEPD